MPDEAPVEPEPTHVPTPPDPAGPLKRDAEGDDEEGHPGIDPVTRPVPPD